MPKFIELTVADVMASGVHPREARIVNVDFVAWVGEGPKGTTAVSVANERFYVTESYDAVKQMLGHGVLRVSAG